MARRTGTGTNAKRRQSAQLTMPKIPAGCQLGYLKKGARGNFSFHTIKRGPGGRTTGTATSNL